MWLNFRSKDWRENWYKHEQLANISLHYCFNWLECLLTQCFCLQLYSILVNKDQTSCTSAILLPLAYSRPQHVHKQNKQTVRAARLSHRWDTDAHLIERQLSFLKISEREDGDFWDSRGGHISNWKRSHAYRNKKWTERDERQKARGTTHKDRQHKMTDDLR